jgi:hypothetical protein
MALTAREAKQLATCANSLESLVRGLHALNTNILAIHEQMLVISGKLSKQTELLGQEKAKTDAVIRDANQLELPNIVDEMRQNTGWSVGDMAKVTDPETDVYGWTGKVVNGRGWPIDFQVEIEFDFADPNLDVARRWLYPKQLRRLLKRKNEDGVG